MATLKGDALAVPYRVQNMFSADLLIANLVDIRMLCTQSSVTREVCADCVSK